MRKPFALVLTTALLAAAAACGGGGSDTLAGQSGANPVVTEASTTTTEEPVTDDTLPERVVEIPDTSDTGLTWSEAPVVDDRSGRVNLNAINRLIVEATDLTAMVPADEIEALSDEDEREAAIADASALASRKAVAVFLGLEPGQADTQMIEGDVGGPEARRIVVIQLQEDDSVRAVRWEFTAQVLPRGQIDRENPEVGETTTTAGETTDTTEPPETTTTLVAPTPDLIPVLYTATRTVQCQPDRGHQDFSVVPCT